MTTMRTGIGTGQDGVDALVARTLARHHDALRATARRHSLCDDDAADAVQRALELFLRHAGRLEPERAHKWLFTVTKHEAVSLRAERQRVLPSGARYDFDAEEARHEPSPDDRLLDGDRTARVTEALAHLKPAEAQALWLKAAGHSYDEIARDLGWTRTKVNRCLAEGRARLRARLAGIESGEECRRWAPVLGALRDGTADPVDLTAARRHLRNCPGCRASVRAVHEPAGPLAVLPGGLLGILVTLQERAVGGAVRAQTAVEALAGGKAAAVAASAAALAGGGVVAVERAIEPPSRGTQAQIRTAPEPRPTRTRAAGRAPDSRPAVAPAAAPAAVARATTSTTATSPGRAAAPSPAAAPSSRRAPRSAGEFGPDGSGAPATTGAPRTTAGPAAAAPPVAPAARPARASAPPPPATAVADDAALLP